MNFAVPTAFAWALLAAPIIVFYILKVRLRRAPTSTSLFWNQVYDEKPPRSIWETLKHLLSLLAQLALLMLLVFALTDPIFRWQQTAAQRIVFVIDNSASMRATDVRPTRFEAARAAAIAACDSLRYGDQLAIVVAGDRPRVAVGMSDHIPTLKRVMADLDVSDAPTNLQPAIDLARRVLGDHAHGRTVLFTDGCYDAKPQAGDEAAASQAGEIAASDSASNLELRIFGAESGNVGITQFQVRRSLVDPLGYEILTAVRNASNRSVECRLELELNGAPVDVLPLKLEPEETWSRALQKTSLDGGRLTARLVDLKPSDDGAAFNDPLAADDAAQAVLPGREIQNVLLVTPGNLFLQKVLEANSLVKLEVVNTPPAAWPAETLIVLHRQELAELPRGNVWAIDPRVDSDAWKAGGDLENPIVTEQDAESPLMRHVKLDNVLMPKARKLTFAAKPHILAGAVSGDPVYAEVPRESGRLLVLTVDIEEGDLTFRTAFPIMVTNALGWFSGEAGELTPALTTGSVARIPIPDDARDRSLNLTSPDGDSSPILLAASPLSTDADESDVTDERHASIGPLERVGIWQVTAESAGGVLPSTTIAELACNLANPRETDIRTPADLLTATTADPLQAGWLTRPVWFYCAIAALLLAFIEWCLYQRRLIR